MSVAVYDVSSSDEEVDDEIPEASVCQQRIDEFIAVTNTDQAFAQMFLQRRKWELQRALNEYFSEGNQVRPSSIQKDWLGSVLSRDRDGSIQPTYLIRPVTGPVSVASGSDDSGPPRAKHMRTQGEARGATSAGSGEEEVDWHTLKFISWNIDGLTDRNIRSRVKCVAKHILDLKIDFAFLQEVTVEAMEVLKSELDPDYEVVPCRESKPSMSIAQLDYFVALCIRKTETYNYSTSCMWRPFPGSQMDRGLQVAKIDVKKKAGDKVTSSFSLFLVNTHLESTKEFASERKKQLKRAFAVLEELASKKNTACVFAGDLNLRDTEIVDVGGIPSIATDMWEACGAKEYLRYTWDARRNNNCAYHNPKSGARLRFDRAYVAQKEKFLEPEHFGLQGLTKVPGHQCFPSDHWALYFVLKRVPGM